MGFGFGRMAKESFKVARQTSRQERKEQKAGAKAYAREERVKEKETARREAFHERLTQLGAQQAGTNARLKQRGFNV